MRCGTTTLTVVLALFASVCAAERRRVAANVREAADYGKKSLVPPVYLPDGREFRTWEVAAKFTKTFHVNQSHPKASDDNPGTEARPFLTINRAAQVLRPGQRVVVVGGTYRERVIPLRGGTGPEKMISYEAAPGPQVVIKGSQPLQSRWVPSTRNATPGSPKLWMAKMPEDLFGEQNPFNEINLTAEQIDKCMPWAVPTKGKVPNTLRRGLLFQNGKRLTQVASPDALVESAGSYWVEKDGLALHVRP
ncbi:MAG: hypothetical protein ACYSWU_09435, partial [Planctomycetota bacterium]